MPGAAYGPGAEIARLGKAMLRDRGRLDGLQAARSTTPDFEGSCGCICTSCGWLSAPVENLSPQSQEACMQCGACEWAELRRGVVVEALDMLDSDRRSDAEAGGAMGYVMKRCASRRSEHSGSPTRFA